jgi:hypothetical protein
MLNLLADDARILANFIHESKGFGSNSCNLFSFNKLGAFKECENSHFRMFFAIVS